jgi:hypothetical protein
MTMEPTTSRRSFLKSGAIAAAPLVVTLPSAAFAADDGSKGRLARLEDQSVIGRLHREIIGDVNRGDRELAKGLTGLSADPAHELQIAFADDGHRATGRRPCTAIFRTEFTGSSTLEQMHRLQGQGAHEHVEARVLITEYVKRKDGWAIETLRLA